MLSLEALEERIGYVFQDKKLLRRAVTHRSFAQEHNERLEFLGDSVLNCVIGYALFLRDKHFNEGELSRVRANLVCEKTLHEIALKIDVSSFLYMGEGEVKTGGAHRASILADAMEAIFGAVFREAGFDTAQRVILKLYDQRYSPIAIFIRLKAILTVFLRRCTFRQPLTYLAKPLRRVDQIFWRCQHHFRYWADFITFQ